jgi:hypothetical protein
MSGSTRQAQSSPFEAPDFARIDNERYLRNDPLCQVDTRHSNSEGRRRYE